MSSTPNTQHEPERREPAPEEVAAEVAELPVEAADVPIETADAEHAPDAAAQAIPAVDHPPVVATTAYESSDPQAAPTWASEPVASEPSAAESVTSGPTEAGPIEAGPIEAGPIEAGPTAESAASEPASPAVPPVALDTPAEPTAESVPPAEPESEAQESAPAAPTVLVATPVTSVFAAEPAAPKPRSNRLGGILISLVATLAFAVVYAGIVLLILAIDDGFAGALDNLGRYFADPTGYLPIIVFALALILLVTIVNRAGWWAYVFGGFFVGALVYGAYIAAVLLVVQSWTLSAPELSRALSQIWSNPLAIAPAIIAREVTVWFGAWIGRRGRKLSRINAATKEAQNKKVSDEPGEADRAETD